MPIALPSGLPARKTLAAEGLEVVDSEKLLSWGRRPLRVCLVNLMPNKPATELQFARLLAGTPIPVELVLSLPDGYQPKSTPANHLAFYRPWSAVRREAIDALIVTGAPIEELPFEEVTYWKGLCDIFDWARTHPVSSLTICWAAQAALYHMHGVAKRRLERKLFGVYAQQVMQPESPLLTGFSDVFSAPVSRQAEVLEADFPAHAGLSVLATSAGSGLCLVQDMPNRALHMFNHLEYDAGTLGGEYLRDRQAGKEIGIPQNYFPGDDPQKAPINVWRAFGQLLVANWLADISRKARPRISDEPVIQWTLAEMRSAGQADNADLLVQADASGPDMLPDLLRKLDSFGLSASAVKVHRGATPELLIEIRLPGRPLLDIESVAKRLCTVPRVVKAAFRAGNTAGICNAQQRSIPAISRPAA
jgi:homoserine O-succinyltransferase